MALAGLAVGVVNAPAAFAQTDTGPVIVGERRSLEGLTLDHLSAAIELYGRYRYDERDRSGQPKRTGEEITLRTDLELSGRAFVGDPDLLDINGVVTLGLERVKTNGDIEDDRTDDSLRWLFDVNALILAGSEAPLTLYARRDENQLDREFSPSIDSYNTEYGAIWSVNIRDIPTTFQYFHREVEQDDPLDISSYDLVQDTFLARSNYRIGQSQEIRFEYTLDFIDESRGDTFQNDFERNDLLLQHRVNFGDDNQSFLRSTARYFDETGLFPFERFRIDEQLWLQHTRRFETIYNFSYENQNRDTDSQDFLLGSATARYELFESLVASGTLGASELQLEDGFESTETFADLNLRYTKRVPYGRLDASGALNLNEQDNSERGSPVNLFRQPVIFPDAAPAIIERSNIVPGSVVVRDAAGVQTFIEGLDYTADYFPDRVELRRIVGGDIAPGELTLVDFTIGPEPANTISSVGTSYTLRYTIQQGALAGLSPYIEYQEVDRDVDSVAPELLFVDDVRNLRYGADYRRGPFTLLAERQERDSELSPFDRTRLEGRWEQRLGFRSRLSLTLTYEEFEFPLEDDTTTLNRAILRYDGRPRSDLDVNLFLEYRDEDSDRFGDSIGFDQSIEVVWRKGRTVISGAVRNTFFDSDNEDRTSQEYRLAVRREF